MNAAPSAYGSDVIGSDVDMLGYKNATLLLVYSPTASSDLRNLEVWTSTVSDSFLVSGTTGAAVASDGTYQVTLLSDESNFRAQGLSGGTISDVTVASNTVASIKQAGVYAFNLKNISRYLNLQYDAEDATGKVVAVFLGHDADYSAPPKAKQAAY
jgi:hypothetical protein